MQLLNIWEEVGKSYITTLNPRQKAPTWTAKERYRNTSPHFTAQYPPQIEPKHYQQQSKLQAALKNTKEHADTNF